MAAFQQRAASKQEREALRELWLSSFVAERHWPEIRQSIQLVEEGKLSGDVVKQTLKQALEALSEGLESLGEALEDLRQDDLRAALFVALYNLVGTAVQKRMAAEQLQADLRDKLQAPGALVQLVVAAYKSQYDALSSAADRRRIAVPGLANIQWRVDVTISTTALNRVFTPTIMMCLTLTDGTMRTFECSVESFHQLRYNVAKALRNVHNLANHPTLNRLES